MNDTTRAATALKNLPPFPPVVAKVITLLNGEYVSLQVVVDTLKTDAGLSAEVLRLANSPLVAATRYEVTGILQALSVVGLKRLAGLVMTLGLSKFLKRAGSTTTMRRCWRHNLACGLAAAEFARSFGTEADEAYNGGLFHDLGRLAILAAEPNLYDGWNASAGEDAREFERKHFGMDHCEAGAWVVENWKLPRIFGTVARYHHDPQPGSELTMLVNGACAVANRLGFSLVQAPPGEVDHDPNDPLGVSIMRCITQLEAEYGL